MLCTCHGEAMRWHNDSRYRTGGFWSCRVTDRARHRERYATELTYRVAARRRQLTYMRASTLEQLGQLREEAEALGAES